MHHRQDGGFQSKQQGSCFVIEKLDQVFGHLAATYGSESLSAALARGYPEAVASAVAGSIAATFDVPFTPSDLKRAASFQALVTALSALCSDPGAEELRQKRLPRVPRAGCAIDDVGPGTYIGPYVVVRKIGEGGFGSVFQARHQKSGDAVALKAPSGSGGAEWLRCDLPDPCVCADAWCFRPGRITSLHASPQIVDTLFHAEAARLKVSPEGTPQFRETLKVGGRPWLVTDFVQGVTLRERMLENPVFPRSLFVSLVLACVGCGGHGDIKPENVIVSPDYGVTVVDPAVTIRSHNIRTATAAYNPFLLTGKEADVQSIGIILYEVMTGRLPFESVPFPGLADSADSLRTRFRRNNYLSFQPIAALRNDCPRWLDALVGKCLLDRTYSLEQLAADLQRG